jgi:polysaccharide biosynthesis protein PelF
MTPTGEGRPLRVCLILEGTYPYVPGGVSGWTHELIQQLPQVEFVLLTLSPRRDQTYAYTLPANVTEVHDHLLQLEGNELTLANRSAAAVRLQRVAEQLGPAIHPDVEELLRDLETATELNPMAGTSVRRGPRSRMRRFWQEILERYQRENPFYALGEYFWTWFNSRALLLALLQIEIPPADVYHTLCTGYAGFVGALARVSTGRPLMLTEHGIYHRERSIEIDANGTLRGHQRDQWKRLFFALSRLTYAAADQVITLFEANRQLELNLGAPPERSRVIPNGIDLPRYRAVQREIRPGFHVGLVGRIVPIKDVKTFIVAARGVMEELPDARFHCIGPLDESPEYVEECRDLVRALGLEEQFSFTGRQDVREYYSFLDVVVLSSLSEAQPLVILEALAAGVPVVSTRVGDVPGLLDEQDRFIALPKDAEGLIRRVVGIRTHRDTVDQWVSRRQQVLDTVYDRTLIFGTYGRLYHEIGGMPWPA